MSDNGTTNEKEKDVALVARRHVLESFSDDVRHLWCSLTVPVMQEAPCPTSFYRDYVSKSTPCIIRNAVLNPSTNTPLTLTLDELCSRDENLLVTVDVTPDGHGDSVRTVKDGSDRRTKKQIFVKPLEEKMTLSEFRDRLRTSQQNQGRRGDESSRRLELDESGKAIYSLVESNGSNEESSTSLHRGDEVLYYSRQNDCLRTELGPLFGSCMFPQTIEFAEEAFGVTPDAINLWIGNERVVSSMHKDHYENLFYVLSGEKIFTLCPPADAPFLYQNGFDSGAFCQTENGEWSVQQDFDDENGAKVPSRVQWIEGDVEPLVDNPTACPEQFSLLSLAHPIRVHVKEGEMLYLPALWFHRVTQTSETLGVNYWFDMRFDSPSWCYFNLLQQLQVVDGTETSEETS